MELSLLKRPPVVYLPQHVNEPEGSLPFSQELSSCSYPEPYQSIPYQYILFLSAPF
jgi:hypothetical protein